MAMRTRRSKVPEKMDCDDSNLNNRLSSDICKMIASESGISLLIDTPKSARRASSNRRNRVTVIKTAPKTPDQNTNEISTSISDSANHTLNETFSPEPNDVVFTKQELIDSAKKQKRTTKLIETKENLQPNNETPRQTKRSHSFGNTSTTKKLSSSKKKNQDSLAQLNLNPAMDNFSKLLKESSTEKSTVKTIKSIRKKKRSLSVTDFDVDKKNVTFHSPANREISVLELDKQIQTHIKKAAKRIRSVSNAETKNEKKIKLNDVKEEMTNTINKKEKRTPNSRTKLPNFNKIHERLFDSMQSISEHAAKKIERAKNLFANKSPGLRVTNTSTNPTNAGVSKITKYPRSKLSSPKPVKKIEIDTNTKKIRNANTKKETLNTSKIPLPIFNSVLRITNNEQKVVIPKNVFEFTGKKQKIQSTSTILDSNVGKVIVDKVTERRQKNINLYKARPTEKQRIENVRGVRSNRRFELQMKFRQNIDKK